MIKNSGGGDFVVIRSSGADGYNPYVYSELGGVDSIETLIIDSEEKANCPETFEKIKNAEALFIAGGDQSKYYSYWKNSKVEEALNYLVNEKRITIGGTSAGLAILGEIVYTAENASVDSKEVLKNPLTDRITLKNDFLNIPLLKDIITDTHFNQRNRQGRLIAYTREVKSGLSTEDKLKAIGVDENTAVLLDSNGIGKIFAHNAYF
ncbi:MAG: cyanophycinase [Candidatus Sericytochromatia bacterium]